MKPTKSASGSKNAKQGQQPVLTQRQWRKAGICLIAACALLAWVGASNNFLLDSPLLCILCWGTFAVLLGATGLIVWVDIRYIRLLYVIEKRNLFRDTLGDESFRKALLKQEHSPNDKE